MADGCKGVLLDRNTLLRRAATWELPPITVRCLIGFSLTTLQTHPLHLLFRPLEARLASALLLIAQSSSEEGQGRFLVIPPPPRLFWCCPTWPAATMSWRTMCFRVGASKVLFNGLIS